MKLKVETTSPNEVVLFNSQHILRGGMRVGTGDIETDIGINQDEEKAYQLIAYLRKKEKEGGLSLAEQKELALLRRKVNPLPPR